MRVKETTIAYLAGLVDGEGYVGIKKDLSGVRSGKQKSPSYHERIQVRMVDEPAIKLFSEVFGGNYYFEKNHSKSQRPLYCFQISDLAAAKALVILLPYLRIKNNQAKICLALRRNKESKLAKQRGNLGGRRKGRGKPMAKSVLKYRDNLWNKLKKIHRGASNG